MVGEGNATQWISLYKGAYKGEIKLNILLY